MVLEARLGGGMTQPPAMPLFVRDYRMDTLHLSTEQHGAYLLLLMQAWSSPQARLPDCDEKLAAWAGLDLARWRILRPSLEPFFIIRGGWWTQKRLSKEWHFVRGKIAARRNSGREGGLASARSRARKGGKENDNDDRDIPATIAQATVEHRLSNRQPTSLTLTQEEGAQPSRVALDPAREPLAVLRIGITKLYAELRPKQWPPPETGHAAIWLANGYPQDLILAVIRKVLERKTEVRGLEYFDPILRDEHAKRASLNGRPANGAHPAEPDPETARAAKRIRAVAHFRGKWSDAWTGPKPGEPGFPDDIAAEAARECGVPWPPKEHAA
jgi:uncharacterized protein YdaU (DUF1376 family)